MDDFMDEELEAEPVVQSEPGKARNLPFIPKEEEVDVEEFERMMEERYMTGSTYVTEDNYENKRSIDRIVLELSAKDPVIWKVKCGVGRERHSAFCMMQKFVDLGSMGTKLQIISAFAVDHIKGFVFIEADKLCPKPVREDSLDKEKNGTFLLLPSKTAGDELDAGLIEYDKAMYKINGSATPEQLRSRVDEFLNFENEKSVYDS